MIKYPVFLTSCCVLALMCAVACSHEEYDISRGIDKEITLFTDEVSLPVGDFGPLTPRALLSKSGMGDTLNSFVKEDEDGYLVVESQGSCYSNPVLLVSFFLPDQTKPVDLPVDAYSGNLGSTASSLGMLGFSLSPQIFSFYAGNPLTEEIAVSGKVTLSSQPEDGNPEETLISRSFSHAKVGAGVPDGVIFREEYSGDKAMYGCRIEDLVLHLPASILGKDPLGGMGSFSLSYSYKSYLSLSRDFPEGLQFDISDLNIPLAQFRVKEARISTDVSSEIPVTLEVGKVEVLVKTTGEDGNESIVPSEDVSVTPGLTVASGSSGSPTVSPLEIVIRAREATIPDISGLRLSFSVKAPTGSGDKRLGMNQTVFFNNIRATVSGGITIQNL